MSAKHLTLISAKHFKCLSSLIDACFDGNLAVVDKILNRRSDRTDFSKEDTSCALHAACAHGHHLVVDRLLKDKRFTPSNEPNRFRNELIAAATEGHVKVVERLLQDRRMKLSKTPDVGNVCLRFAIANNYTNVVNQIIADPYFDRFLKRTSKQSKHSVPFMVRYGFVTLADIIDYASLIHYGTTHIQTTNTALCALLEDMRVLFSSDEKCVIDARRGWYEKRAIDMQELHEELVATVACASVLATSCIKSK